MQSGISASRELLDAFQTLLSDTTQRGLLVGISSSPEQLVPIQKIPSTSSDFKTDLSAHVGPLLESNVARYIILRQDSSSAVAVTFVPEKAPVRQKMLFASTRLSLVRELGSEHFPQTLFVTDPAELTAAGWSAHEAHGHLSAPLTTAETANAALADAVAAESTGTSTRTGGHLSSTMSVAASPALTDALRNLAAGALVYLVIQIGPNEELDLRSTRPASNIPADNSTSNIPATELSADIPATEPSYTFYRDAATGKVLFVYTCPPAATVRQRMVYASMRRAAAGVGEACDAGVVVTRAVEVGAREELTGPFIVEELGLGLTTAAAGRNGDGDGEGGAMASTGMPTARMGFARPKRPGKR